MGFRVDDTSLEETSTVSSIQPTCIVGLNADALAGQVLQVDPLPARNAIRVGLANRRKQCQSVLLIDDQAHQPPPHPVSLGLSGPSALDSETDTRRVCWSVAPIRPALVRLISS